MSKLLFSWIVVTLLSTIHPIAGANAQLDDPRVPEPEPIVINQENPKLEALLPRVLSMADAVRDNRNANLNLEERKISDIHPSTLCNPESKKVTRHGRPYPHLAPVTSISVEDNQIEIGSAEFEAMTQSVEPTSGVPIKCLSGGCDIVIPKHIFDYSAPVLSKSLLLAGYVEQPQLFQSGLVGVDWCTQEAVSINEDQPTLYFRESDGTTLYRWAVAQGRARGSIQLSIRFDTILECGKLFEQSEFTFCNSRSIDRSWWGTD